MVLRAANILNKPNKKPPIFLSEASFVSIGSIKLCRYNWFRMDNAVALTIVC